jgi:CRISPR type I-E-associated protein CasB/Cse2
MATPHEQDGLPSVVGALAHAIEKLLSPGDVAELRRLHPTDLSYPVFWRICAAHLAPVLPLGAARDEAERRWAVILQALAELRGLHSPGARYGRALASAGIAELRALRMLRASGSALYDSVRTISRYLAATGTPANCSELALLVLSDGRDEAESIRRRIARDYYAQLEKETSA